MSGWRSSDRRSRLPPDWQRRRRIVLERDPLCQLRYPDLCTTKSTEVDHRIAGDDHRLANLQGVCSPCHLRKTTTERDARSRRKPEQHPGRIT